jgi:hypothetical protein
MLHEKVTFRAEREGRDCRLRTQEALIIAVVGDAVLPRGVVVDEAKVIFAASGGFGALAEVVQAFGNGSR